MCSIIPRSTALNRTQPYSNQPTIQTIYGNGIMSTSSASLLSSSSTSSLSSIYIVTPPYSDKDVLVNASFPPRPSCIHNHSNKKQTREVSWGVCDEIIMVKDDPNENCTGTTTTTMFSYSTETVPNLPGSTIPSTNFPMSMTNSSSDNSCHNVDTTASAATTYLELEQQFRHSLCPTPPLKGTPSIDYHRYRTGPFQSFVHFRTYPVHDDDDSSSCYTAFNDNENDTNTDYVIYRSDLDFAHGGTNHNLTRDDNEEDEEEEDYMEILQTPNHTMFYYYNYDRNSQPRRQSASSSSPPQLPMT